VCVGMEKRCAVCGRNGNMVCCVCVVGMETRWVCVYACVCVCVRAVVVGVEARCAVCEVELQTRCAVCAVVTKMIHTF
jgi:hypothetical protein